MCLISKSKLIVLWIITRNLVTIPWNIFYLWLNQFILHFIGYSIKNIVVFSVFLEIVLIYQLTIRLVCILHVSFLLKHIEKVVRLSQWKSLHWHNVIDLGWVLFLLWIKHKHISMLVLKYDLLLIDFDFLLIWRNAVIIEFVYIANSLGNIIP